jgi:hypothetical protein
MIREDQGLGLYRPEGEGTEVSARYSELELELIARNPVAFPPLQNAEPSLTRLVNMRVDGL